MNIKISKKAPVPLEDEIHKAIANICKLSLPDDVIWYHTPNGGERNVRVAKKLKAMGTLAGVPDLTFHHAGKTFFIEVKRPGSYLSPEQKSFRDRALKAGCAYTVCRSSAEAVEAMKAWGLIYSRLAASQAQEAA